MASAENPDAPALRDWHCYLHAAAGNRRADVRALSAADAAVLAATQTGQPGDWTVCPGPAVKVQVRPKTGYESISEGSAQ